MNMKAFLWLKLEIGKNRNDSYNLDKDVQKEKLEI